MLESTNAFPAGLALQAGGALVIGATASPKTGNPPASDGDRAVVVRMTGEGRLANPPITLLADTPSTITGVSPGLDGGIVIAGYGSAVPRARNRRFLIGRLLRDGMPDDGFGGGVVLANVRPSWWAGAVARAAAVDPDGKIVATGSAEYSTGPLSQSSYCATARLDRGGELDRTFGDKGRVLTTVRDHDGCAPVAVHVARDNKIVVVGNTSVRSFVLIRYRSDGSPDERFGTGGVAEFFGATAWGAAIDSNGRTVVVGTKWLSPSRTQFLVARYDGNGILDPVFGAGGAVLFDDVDTTHELKAAAIQPDGKIVVAGTLGWHGGKNSPVTHRDEIVVARLTANGTLDTSFANAGVLRIASSRYLWGANAVAIQPDGQLLIVGPLLDEGDGARSSGIVVVRLDASGTPDASFGAAVDPGAS